MPAFLSNTRRLYLRARFELLRGRPENAATLCREALLTPDYSWAQFRAHQMLARLEFPGEDYLTILKRIHQHLKPATYLEIGVDQGISFEIVAPETLSLGVDPNPRLRNPLRSNQRIFAQTSDEFFREHDVIAELGGKPIELAFIDGMHKLEFALRDFINIERNCSADSIILIDDVYPLDSVHASRERASWYWCGDVWRLILILKNYRPDLEVQVIATRPAGLGIVQKLDPSSNLLAERQREIIDEFLTLDISTLSGRKAEMLNRFPNHWSSIAQLIDSRRRMDI